MNDKVAILEFSTRVDAEQAQMLLSGSGIESFIESDDCGGVHPAFALIHGVRLLVYEKDAKRARELLDLKMPDKEKME